ncbi:MAG: glycosyltransferase family 4 protein [Candidatus Margulisiibacteriota bacterium]
MPNPKPLKKILFWSDGFHPRIGGIETLSFDYAQALIARGCQVAIITGKDKSDWPDEEVYQGIQIYRLPFTALIDGRQLGSLKVIKDKVAQVLAEFNPDVIHLQDVFTRAGIVFQMIRPMVPQPKVLTFHGAAKWVPPTPNSLLERTLNGVSHVVYISNFVKGIIQDTIAGFKIPYTVLLNAVRFPKDFPKVEQKNGFQVRFIGRYNEEKGLPIALKSFELFAEKHPEATLTFIGEGLLKKSLQMAIANSPVRSQIQDLGKMTHDEILPYYATADCVVMPSQSEWFGLVALHAAHAGVPVLANNEGGLCEIVVHQKTGYLLPTNDYQAFANAMADLYANPKTRKAMGEAAKAHVQGHFDLERTVDRLLKIYDSVC